jgi:tape measure domain-containing protein
VTTVAKELAVKFTELGLEAIGAKADKVFRDVGARFDDLIRRNKALAASIVREQSGDAGPVAKNQDANNKALIKSTSDMAKAVVASFKTLRVQSSTELDIVRDNARSAFAGIREAGLSSVRDISRAQQALASKLRGSKVTETALDPGIAASFKSLGVTAQASIDAAKQALVADFAAIKRSGVASASEVALAYRNLKSQLAALNVQQTSAPAASARDTLGIRSTAALRQEIVNTKAALATLARSGAPLDEIARASTAAAAKMRLLQNEIRGIDANARGVFRRTTAAIASFTFEATGAIFGLSAAVYGLAKPFVAVANLQSKFQSLTATMLSLGDSSELAAKEVAFIKDLSFGDKTKFNIDEITQAFIRLKTGGIDPTKGALLTILDAVTATGGSVEQLDKVTLAINQIASKTKVQSEELVGQLAESLPGAVKVAADALNLGYEGISKNAADNTKELLAKLKQGGVGAKEFLTALFLKLQELYGGAGQRALTTTFEGTISRFKKLYQSFLDDIGTSGAFDSLDNALKQMLENLQRAKADGSLRAFAQDISDAMVSIINGVVAAGKFIREFGGILLKLAEVLIVTKVVRSVAAALLSIPTALLGIRTAFAGAAGAARVAAAGFGGLIPVFTTLRTLFLSAIGPLGWIAAVGFALYELARAAETADKQIDRLKPDAPLSAAQIDKEIELLNKKQKALKDLAETEIVTEQGATFKAASEQEIKARQDELVKIGELIASKLRQKAEIEAKNKEAEENSKKLSEAFEKVGSGAADQKNQEKLDKANKLTELFSARLSLIRQFAKVELDAEKQNLRRSSEQLDFQLQHNLISIREYYEQKAALAKAAGDKEIRALDEERQRILREAKLTEADLKRIDDLVKDEGPLTKLQTRTERRNIKDKKTGSLVLGKDGKPKQRSVTLTEEVPLVTKQELEARTKLLDVEERRRQVVAETANEIANAARDSVVTVEQLERSFIAVRAELADLKGDTVTAAKLQLEDQFKDPLRQLNAEIDGITKKLPPAFQQKFIRVDGEIASLTQEEQRLREEYEKMVAAVDNENVKKLIQTRAELQKVVDDIERIKALRLVEIRVEVIRKESGRIERDLRAAKDAIQSDVERGLITETRAKEKIQSLEQDAGARLELRRSRLQDEIALMKALGQDVVDLQADLKELDQRIFDLKNPIDEVAASINTATRSAFSDLFSDIFTGAKKASQAISDFAKSVLKSFADILSRKFAEKLFDSFSSGIGALGSSVLGFFGIGGVKKDGGVIKRTEGGPVAGPGTGTSDSVPAIGPMRKLYRLSNGEFVVRAKAVKHLGLAFMERINRMQGGIIIPRFAAGGMVGRSLSAAASGKTGKAAAAAAPPVVLQIHPEAAHMMLKDWFYGEMARAVATR